MKHLDDHQIIETLAGRGSEAERAHAASCERCGQSLASWRQNIEGLRELDGESASDREIHRLRVMFRQLGPSPQRRPLVARLVRRSGAAAMAAATRGGVTSTFEEYEADPFGAVIQIRPALHDLYDVHGQLSSHDGTPCAGSVAMLAADNGWGRQVTLDGHGEFWLRGVAAGRYSLAWVVGTSVVRIDELVVGDEDDGQGG
jgi:hypothetical protein